MASPIPRRRFMRHLAIASAGATLVPRFARAQTDAPSPPPPKLTWRRITPRGSQMFFGYYDIEAFDSAGLRHLAHRVPFRDRLPTARDVAELGCIDLGTGEFSPCATTRAWNFQQGALLQWLDGAAQFVVFNDLAADGSPHGVVLALASRRRRELSRPVATLSRDGRWALSINFERMYAFRPGYGYAGRPDPRSGVAQPDDDGVFLVDVADGRSRLVLSLAAIGAAMRPVWPGVAEEKLLINHITLNPAATRFVMIVRNFPKGGAKGSTWKTAVLTATREGGDVRIVIPPGYASHYWWHDDTSLLFHSDGPQGKQLYMIADTVPSKFSTIAPGFFLKDGHCRTSPDGRWISYDSYPDRERRQHFFLYDLAGGRGWDLDRFDALPANPSDIRTDLHPRWNHAGTALSIDSTHEGERAIYLAATTTLLEPGAGDTATLALGGPCAPCAAFW